MTSDRQKTRRNSPGRPGAGETAEQFCSRLRHGAPCRLSGGGFTLIEVLVSVVILSVGIVVVLQSFGACLSALGAAGETVRSASLARGTMGEIELAARNSRDGLKSGVDGGQYTGADSGFFWESRIEEIERASFQDSDTRREYDEILSRVNVRVWKKRGGRVFDIWTYLKTREDR